MHWICREINITSRGSTRQRNHSQVDLHQTVKYLHNLITRYSCKYQISWERERERERDCRNSEHAIGIVTNISSGSMGDVKTKSCTLLTQMQYGSTIWKLFAIHGIRNVLLIVYSFSFSGTADFYYGQALKHQAEGKGYSEPRDTRLTTEQLSRLPSRLTSHY